MSSNFWTTFEAYRASILDTVRTVIFLAGVLVAIVQLRKDIKLRRLQVLYSLNERLSRCSRVYDWISFPDKEWAELTPEQKYDYLNYITAFEDIGIARRTRVISRFDF